MRSDMDRIYQLPFMRKPVFYPLVTIGSPHTAPKVCLKTKKCWILGQARVVSREKLAFLPPKRRFLIKTDRIPEFSNKL